MLPLKTTAVFLNTSRQSKQHPQLLYQSRTKTACFLMQILNTLENLTIYRDRPARWFLRILEISDSSMSVNRYSLLFKRDVYRQKLRCYFCRYDVVCKIASFETAINFLTVLQCFLVYPVLKTQSPIVRVE